MTQMAAVERGPGERLIRKRLTEERSVERTAEPPTDAGQGCPMGALLETLTRPWTFHIIWQLTTHGPMRFGALRRAIAGISPRLLTVRLRALEAEGFVRRTVMGGKVPEVTYAPTPRLADMQAVMENLHGLSLKWRGEDVGQGGAFALAALGQADADSLREG